MDNVVKLGRDRARPRRTFEVPRNGARILFFTGVRYCREDQAPSSGMLEPHVIRDHGRRTVDSGLALDLAAH